MATLNKEQSRIEREISLKEPQKVIHYYKLYDDYSESWDICPRCNSTYFQKIDKCTKCDQALEWE